MTFTTKIVKGFNSRLLHISMVLFFAVAFFWRCANPVAPSGGPVDSLPPKIVSITPAMFSTNFNASEVTIEFDEYVVTHNVTSEVLISPFMESRPEFTVKGKSLVIKFNEPLDSATTYKIHFGQAIKDNNEGNPLVNFSYVFSTGDYIDSLAMSGQVIDAFTGDSILNSLVLLYDASIDTLDVDSLIFRSKPASITRTDSMGIYLATNLKPIDYKIYAIVEDVSSGKYEKGTEPVAFIDSAINPTTLPPFDVWFNPLRKTIEATPQVVMRAFMEEAGQMRQNLTKIDRSQERRLDLYFMAHDPIIEEIFVDSVDMDKILYKYSQHSDSISLFFPIEEDVQFPDTLRGFVAYQTVTTDSMPTDTVITREFAYGYRKIKAKRNKDEEEVNPFEFKSDASATLHPKSDISFTFKYPILAIDSSRIELTRTIVEEQKEQRGARGSEAATQTQAEAKTETIVEPFIFEQDSINILTWRLKSEWQPASSYQLLIPDSAFVNIIHEKNDTIQASFKIMNPEDFGVVILNISDRNPEMNYIVSLVEPKGKKPIYTIDSVNSDQVRFEYVKGGQYSIQIIEDKNNNKEWDGGDVLNRIQPERVAIYRDDSGASSFEVKANWEIEQQVDIQAHLDGKVKFVAPTLENIEADSLAGTGSR